MQVIVNFEFFYFPSGFTLFIMIKLVSLFLGTFPPFKVKVASFSSRVVNPSFFWVVFAWDTFSFFTLDLSAALFLRHVFCSQHVVGFCSFSCVGAPEGGRVWLGRFSLRP